MPNDGPLCLAYRFLPDGTVLAPEAVEDSSFYLGVGGIDHPRVFDHHRTGLPIGTTPASLVWEQRAALAGAGRDSTGTTLVCHHHPHWNTCWAATLLLDLLAGKTSDPERVEALNRFSAFVLAGHNPVEGTLEDSPLAVFESLMAEAEEVEDPAQRDLRKLQEGIVFFRYLLAQMVDYASLARGGLIKAHGPYGTLLPRIRADYQAYLRDLHQGRRFSAALAHRGGTTQWVDGLLLRQPVARLFKFWARADRDHSPGRAGFPLLWVQWASDHWIISVDPASGYTLKGLGDALTTVETRCHPPPADTPPRPGYRVPDPWFDGRGGPGAFGLVACPRAGTRLSQRQVERRLRAFFRVRQWRPAFTRPSYWRDRWPSIAWSAAASVGISLVGLAMTIEQPGTCPQWSALSPLEVNDGHHYAIAIGINDYESASWSTLRNPVADARQVLELLIAQYGFEPVGDQGSRLLLSGEPVLTEKAIRDAIQSLAERLTDQDSLIIYYAGHGTMDASFGYWVPQDARTSANYIDDAWLRQVLRGSRARHLLVISDSCFSGKLAGVGADPISRERTGESRGGLTWRDYARGEVIHLGRKLAPDENLRAQYQLPSRQFMSSGYFERVPDGTGDHSPFASCLIDTLRNNRQPYLDGRNLFHLVKNCIQNSAHPAPDPKRMSIPEACDGQGDLVLRRRLLRAGAGATSIP